MRITASEVEAIVTKLLAPIDEKYQQLEDSIKRLVANYLVGGYSSKLAELVSQRNKFLNWKTYTCIYYLGQHKGINFPAPGVVVESPNLNIASREVAEGIQKCVNEQVELKKKRAALSADLEDTIKRLRTHERLRKEFPEAAEYLPYPETRNLPALNISDIQNKLKELP